MSFRCRWWDKIWPFVKSLHSSGFADAVLGGLCSPCKRWMESVTLPKCVYRYSAAEPASKSLSSLVCQCLKTSLFVASSRQSTSHIALKALKVYSGSDWLSCLRFLSVKFTNCCSWCKGLRLPLLCNDCFCCLGQMFWILNPDCPPRTRIVSYYRPQPVVIYPMLSCHVMYCNLLPSAVFQNIRETYIIRNKYDVTRCFLQRAHLTTVNNISSHRQLCQKTFRLHGLQ